MSGLDVVAVGELNPDLGYLNGWPLETCGTWANACGALTVGRPGGSGAFAGRTEVEAFIRSQAGTGE